MSRIDRRTLIAAGAAGVFVPAGAHAAAGASVGKPAPPFTLTTFDRRTITSADLAGEVVVLNYWATWCAPCRLEMPMMDSFLRRHPGLDLKIFAIATEDSLSNSQLAPLASVFSFQFVTRFSGRGYGIRDGGVPTNYVIDRTGVVRHAQADAFNASNFDALVRPLLDAPKPVLPSAA